MSDAALPSAAPLDLAPTGHATAETAPDVEDLCDTIRNGIYGDDRTSWDTIGKAVEAMNTLAARASQAEALLDVYRNLCAAELGYTLIPEDTTVRPQSMSYVKPSEFDAMAATLTGGGQ